MTWADLKSPVLFTLLGVFAAGWIALYWIMANRVSAAEARSIALHGQQGVSIQALDRRQSVILQDINTQLTTMNGTLGTIEERSQHQSQTLDQLQQSIRGLETTIKEQKQ